MILISNDFWHKIKNDNFEPYNVLLVIATDIPGFVLQGHISVSRQSSISNFYLRLLSNIDILFNLSVP